MAGIGYELVRSTPEVGRGMSFLTERLRSLQKILVHLEAPVISESRADVRIGGRERCSGEPRLLEDRCDRAFLRSNPQYVAPQRKRVARGDYGGHRIVSRCPRRNRILKYDTFSRYSIQKWRSGTVVSEKPDMIGAKTVHRDQNQRLRWHYAEPLCAMPGPHARWLTETLTLTLAEPSAKTPAVTMRYRSSSLTYSSSEYFDSSALSKRSSAAILGVRKSFSVE